MAQKLTGMQKKKLASVVSLIRKVAKKVGPKGKGLKLAGQGLSLAGQGKKMKKGSAAAKAHMAKIRKMKKK